MTQYYDAIVIGAGGMGSAAAYHLARAGHKTLVLEQFTLDHMLGSSFGYSRVIRHTYAKLQYIKLINAVLPMWRELEAQSGESLLVQTGSLNFGKESLGALVPVEQALTQAGIPYERLSPIEATRRFPQFRLDEDMTVVYERQAGVLKPSASVRAHMRLAQQHGAILREHTRVQKVIPAASSVMIQVSGETFGAAMLVIAAGAWSGDILAGLGLDLPLQVTREQVIYFDPKPRDMYAIPNIPVGACWGDEIFYTVGSSDNIGFKVARHYSGEVTTADTVNRKPDEAYLDTIRGFLHQYLPAVGASPVLDQQVCLYTMTPTEDFYLDHHPQYPHIAVGAGFSGHGFKFSTLVGKILAQLASGAQPDYDLSLFRI